MFNTVQYSSTYTDIRFISGMTSQGDITKTRNVSSFIVSSLLLPKEIYFCDNICLHYISSRAQSIVDSICSNLRSTVSCHCRFVPDFEIPSATRLDTRLAQKRGEKRVYGEWDRKEQTCSNRWKYLCQKFSSE